MPAVPPPDPNAATLLKGARAQAFEQLKQEQPDWNPIKAGNHSPPPKGPMPPAPPSAMPTTPRALPSDEQATATQNGPSLTPSDEAPQPPPPPTAANPAGKPGFFQGTGNEIENGVMRGFAELGRAVMLASSVPAIAYDKIAGGTAAQDAVFKAIDNYGNTAVKYWTPSQEETAQHGLGAQVVGGASEVLPALTTGAAALPLLTAQATSSAGIESVQAGQDAKTAGILATVAGVANALGMKIPLKNPSIWKRIGSSILGNEVITTAQQTLAKEILASNGYKEAADNIDPADPKTILTTLLTAIGFGLHRQTGASPKVADQATKDQTKVGTPPPPPGAPPAGPPGAEGTPPPPPPAASGAQAAPPQPVPAAGAQAPAQASSVPAAERPATVPDHPSPESAKDIRAQIVDMNDNTTPRVGVLITHDTNTILAGSKDANAASVNGTLNQAKQQGRTIDVPTGTLVLKSKADATKVQARLAAGEDPQAVVGSVTGASPGTVKTPDQTVVVQGQTPSGAVAAETMVAPADVRTAQIKMEEQGKTAVVTTPDAAQQRRIDEISKERNAPAQMGIMTAESGKEVAVHVESGAPDGQVRVRPIDADGEPSPHTVDVPSDRVRVTKPTEEAATKVPSGSEPEAEQTPKPASSEASEETPAKAAGPTEGVNPPEVPSSETGSGRTVAEDTSRSPSETPPPAEKPQPVAAAAAEKPKAVKPKTALEALPEALETHEQQEQIPEGKKFAAPLAERQDNASAFATVLRESAKGATGKASPEDIARATKAAQAAEHLTEKGKAATDKGQGTGHTKVTALVNEMHKAARALLGNARSGDEERVSPKEAELKARLAKKTIAVKKSVPKEGTSEPKVEVPVGEKYKDQIKSGGGKPREAAPPVERKRTAERFLTEYVHADNDEAPAVREKIEKWLHEEMSDEYTPDEQRQVLHMLDAQREEQNPNAARRTRRMSETIEPEESTLDATDKYEGMQRGGRELLSPQSPLDKIRNTVFKSRLHDEWTKMTTNLLKTGAYTDIVSKHNGTGEHVSSHAILDEMARHTTTPILKDIIHSLRSRAPDVPVYFNDFAKSLRTGTNMETVGGLFHGEENVAQIATAKDKSTLIDPRIVMQTIVHELTHSATMYELNTNPRGELAASLEHARQTLENRLRSQYGDQAIDQHLAYFHGEGKLPETYMRHLYGLKDIHELASEVMANPRFIREIAESELFASPNERGINGQPGLLARIYNAIGRFFGIKDPRLLQHIAGLTEAVMEKQANDAELLGHHLFNRDAARTAATFEQTMAEKFGTNPLEARKAFPTFEALREEPPKLRGVDDELHDEVGPELTRTARAFNWAMKNRGTDAIRTVVTRLKTMDQIFRDHRSDFGDRSDPANPLNTLEDVQSNKNIVINRMTEISKPVAEKWLTLKSEDEIAMAKLMRDATMWKIDPRLAAADQPQEAQDRSGFQNRLADFQARYRKLSPDAQKVFGDAGDANKKLAREFRKAAVDTALHTFTDQEITPAQRSLLYGARTPEIFERLIGEGKLIDVGADRNGSLKDALQEFAGQSEIQGYYQHLGRQGDWVVHAAPEGSREFSNRAAAEAFADQVRDMSPQSKAKVVERGGKIVVDFKTQYTAMHESKLDAEANAARLKAAGFDPGHVTRKTLGKNDTPLGAGARELVAAAESKINRGGHDEGTKALVDSLRSAFLQIAASRSAYAGSRLAREGVAGVKPEDMRRNFAEHAASTIWHAAQLRTVFDQASALAKVRDMARDSHADVSQRVMYRRGEVVQALNEHMQDEVQNFGHKAPLNSALAKLGFMSYLASPSHALIWMTQNFTTGIPVAGAKWGYGKTAVAFTKGMKVFGPAFRATVHAAISKGGNASEVHAAIIEAVKNDKQLGKWAQGSNSPLQQLIDRGVISHGYSNELGALARGDSAVVTRAFEWARLLPNMADAFNRVSTALAGLELSGGDIRQTADFVRQVHADYSQQNKPLLFKKFGRVPGMNSITMFKTYTQSMAHLLYGNLKASMTGDRKAEAAKTVAGMIAANVLFAGVYAGAALEPLRLAMYAYHKLFDEEGEVYDLQNQIHNWLVSHLGQKAGNMAAGGAIPRALGIDLSSRMGLSDLFFHEPPDLLSADKEMWKNFIYNEAGPMASFLAERVTGFVGHMQKGEPFQAFSSIIPIKMYQDAVKAVQLYSTGKTDSLGRQMTEPSGLDAAKQLFGVKPESVALAQEKAGYSINYKGKVNATKEAILKDFVNGDENAMDRVNAFNSLHPAEAIKSRDLRGIGKVAASEPGQSRDEEINANTNF